MKTPPPYPPPSPDLVLPYKLSGPERASYKRYGDDTKTGLISKHPGIDLKSTLYGHIFHIFQYFAYTPIMDSSGEAGTRLE